MQISQRLLDGGHLVGIRGHGGLVGFLLLGPYERWSVRRGYQAWSTLVFGEGDLVSAPWRKSWWWILLSFVALFCGLAFFVITQLV
jgi:hypothetical protein